MAFTETYVSVAGAGAHDGSSEANAWTFAEMISANPAAGTRVNVKAGSYSSGAVSLPSNGTVVAPVVVRGYSSTIGDLDSQGRNANGTLNTTNFPVITLSGIATPASYGVVQNTRFTGALSSQLVGNANVDACQFVSCSITNTQNNAAARCVLGDNAVSLISCDFYCSGAAHASVVDLDQAATISLCRFRGTSASSLLTADSMSVLRSVFYGNASSIGIELLSSVAQTSTQTLVNGNTFYGLGTCVALPNAAPVTMVLLANNHATDCSKWIDNLYSATSNIAVVEINNRLRDITTPRTGIESVTFGEVTTDTGGAETDYTDAANGDFSLISGAPGRGIAAPANTDAGAYQHADPSGGGGFYRRVPVTIGAGR